MKKKKMNTVMKMMLLRMTEEDLAKLNMLMMLKMVIDAGAW